VTVLASTSAVASDIVEPGAPVLTSMHMNNGSFSFSVTGSPGKYVVQASSDLVNWTPIQTNSIATGSTSFIFTNDSATNFVQRFYRSFFSNN
jgi:hypothetical protein